MPNTHTRRGFFWWLTAILAPLGILAGPIGIASMLSGFIEWHGPIGYAVEFWSQFVRPPFATIFQFLANYLHFPEVGPKMLDYLTLGVLLLSSVSRTRGAFSPGTSEISFERFFQVFFVFIAWPFIFLALAIDLVAKRFKDAADWFALTPFVIFIVLWVANGLFA